MRKIEQKMIEAIHARKFWVSGNTCVDYVTAGNPNGPRSEVYLHGNHLGDYWHDDSVFDVDIDTLKRWPSNTTKSRLRALGVDVFKKNHKTYLNGKEL